MRTKSVFLLAVLLTVATFVPMSFSQEKQSGNGAAVAEITRLEQDYLKAELANDPSFVKKHCADDYTTGKQLGKLGY